MALRISVDLVGDLAFGDLYRFVDHARSAGILDDVVVTVETTDALGNEVGAHTLVADLGNVDELSRPVLIDRRDVHRYADALTKELSQESGREDFDVLKELLNDLWAATAE